MSEDATTSGLVFVLDCSVTMAWCFEDESTPYSERVLDLLDSNSARVPTLWSLEVSNVLLIAEKKKRISKIAVANFKNALSALPINVDLSTPTRALSTIFELARETDLTSYDAAYLELAMRERLPICSLDKKVLAVAKQLKVEIL